MPNRFDASRKQSHTTAPTTAMAGDQAPAGLSLLALEPRILFDGAALATLDTVHDTAPDAAREATPYPPAMNSLQADELDAPAAPANDTTQLVFLDATVQDHDAILNTLDEHAEMVILDATTDGVEQMAAVLENRTEIDAIHIISHGSAGQLQLGTAQLNAQTIDGTYADEMATIANALGANADILIYGCDFGEDLKGVTTLAAATGADIAASSDPTGAAASGGDWELEVATGNIEAESIVASGFAGTLAAPVLDNDGDDSSGAGAGGYETTFTENGPAVNIVDSDVTITDPDSNSVTSATITLTNGRIGDALNIGPLPAGLAVLSAPNPPGPLVADGAITLTVLGAGAGADYETALQAITFLSNSEDPDTTDRVFNIQLAEGIEVSNVTSTVVHVNAVNDAAVIDLDADNSTGFVGANYVTTFTEDGPAVAIADVDTLIDDFDGTTLTGVTITLTNPQADDALSLGTLPTGITGSLVNNTITLSGVAPHADYATAIKGITFANASQNPDTSVRIITVEGNDGGGNSNTAMAAVNVVAVNDAPVSIAPIAAQSGNDGDAIPAFKVSGDFDDLDGDTLTFTATNLPTGLSLNSATGEISGTVDAAASQGGDDPVNAPGVYTVTITATDPSGANVSTGFTYTITNVAPVAVDDTATTQENATATGNVLTDAPGTDSDGGNDTDPLTVSQVNGAQGNVGNAIAGTTGGVFTIAANGNWSFDPGTDFDHLATGQTAATSVTYQISDGQGGSDTATLTITLTGTNDTPVALGPLANQSLDEGGSHPAFHVRDVFDDVDGDILTYTATNLPPGLVINTASGEITGVVIQGASGGGDDPVNAPGVYTATITATDPSGDTVSASLVYTIINPAPVAGPIADQTVIATDPFNLATAGTFHDPDGDPLTYSAVGLPPGLAIDPATGLISGATPASAANSIPYQVIVTVDDGDGGQASSRFAITVDPLPNGPVYIPAPSERPGLQPAMWDLTGDDADLHQSLIGWLTLNEIIRDGPLFSGQQDQPYHDGFQLDLTVRNVGEDVDEKLKLRTMVFENYVLIDVGNRDSRLTRQDITVTAVSGHQRPDYPVEVSPGSFLINLPTGQQWIDLRISYPVNNGAVSYWDVRLNAISGEILNPLFGQLTPDQREFATGQHPSSDTSTTPTTIQGRP